LISGVIALVVYARTLMPGIAWGDWGELPTVSHVLGVAHPTGYPTYVILGWFAQLVPLATVAVRLNFSAALFVAGAVATATAISIRLGVRPLIAIGIALAFGFIGTVWAAATVSDAHPLHLFFAALILHRALVWADGREPRDLVVGALLVGLALGNHLLMLFIVPFVALYVVWTGWRELLRHPVLLLEVAVALVIGLSVYVYIPLAARGSPPLPYNHPTTLAGVLWLVSGQQFHGQFDFLAATGPGNFVAALGTLWSLAVARATAMFPVLAAVGFVALGRRRPSYAVLLAVVGFFACYIWANYLELEHYLLVPWLVVAIAASAGLEALAVAGARLVGNVFRRFAPSDGAVAPGSRVGAGAIAGVAALGLAVVLGSLNWAASDRSADRSGQEFVDAVFGALPRDAAILSYWDASTPLWYGRFVEGLRPDVLVVDDTNIVYEGWVTRERRIESLICQRPVFILRPDQADLVPTAAEFNLRPFLAVRVAAGGPTAVMTAEIFRVLPRTACA
jgi:hypothetical protein